MCVYTCVCKTLKITDFSDIALHLWGFLVCNTNTHTHTDVRKKGTSSHDSCQNLLKHLKTRTTPTTLFTFLVNIGLRDVTATNVSTQNNSRHRQEMKKQVYMNNNNNKTYRSHKRRPAKQSTDPNYEISAFFLRESRRVMKYEVQSQIFSTVWRWDSNCLLKSKSRIKSKAFLKYFNDDMWN